MDILHKLQNALKDEKSVLFGYLFGSYAVQQQHWNSDVDIALFLDPKRDLFEQKLLLHHKLQKVLKRDVDLVILNKVRNYDLLEDILQEGVVIKESQDDAREAFEVYQYHLILDYKVLKKSIDVA